MIAVLLMISSFLGLNSASPIANYWLTPLASLNQYHTQDASGSYRYGYTGPHHAKMETRTNGVTQGGYSYIDANGILQTVAYSADPEKGFRVRASNLPKDPESPVQPMSETPEVAAARKRHLEELEKISAENLSQVSTENAFYRDHNKKQVQRDTVEKALSGGEDPTGSDSKNPFLLSGLEASRIEIPKPDPSLLKIEGNRRDASSQNENYHQNTNYQNLEGSTSVVPLPSLHRSIVAPAAADSFVLPVLPYRLLHSSLRHTQDSLGQYDYSYVGDTSSKTESRSLDGTTRGAYSYVDANGLLQQVHYIADHNGFRVLATNLPEA
ncbi:uncharacterized protein [Venturia canescens]|uniref:uncharacterized protein n=1 Tax=Venturia canescens TaxID=32260 RepID=UPI001C9BD2DD|nr:uncharacterized protein LOC122408821 [Venturia canescens]